MPRRALILAGGGMKVAYQAGALQVWLDEAQIHFDLVDGASGGTFNLAMLCQGMSGTEIADNWRGLHVRDAIEPNWRGYLEGPLAESLMRLDRLRKLVFTRWGLDWDRIRASSLEATFNAFDFTEYRTRVLEPAEMSEDFLVACVSLPMWFPPVRIDGHTYIDAVFNTDANLEEAIRRGADELWVIWTVGERGEWQDGFIGNYFGMIETAANGRFRDVLRRIEASNAALERHEHSEWDRRIEVNLLRAEVPLHYLVNLNSDRVTEAVERGVVDARRWCLERGLMLRPPEPATPAPAQPISLSFTEEMKGFIALGEADPERGWGQGRKARTPCTFRLTIMASDTERFIDEPEHEAGAEGWVHSEALGGRMDVQEGSFNLFVDRGGDYDRRRMLYRLFFTDPAGAPLTLSGCKLVEDGHGADVWHDTTTLYVRIFRGHIGADGEPDAEIAAAGILRLHLHDFLHQLTTFRVEGGPLQLRASALARFGLLFLGSLWDVYGRRLLSASPI